jgi:hypothetical protein
MRPFPAVPALDDSIIVSRTLLADTMMALSGCILRLDTHAPHGRRGVVDAAVHAHGQRCLIQGAPARRPRSRRAGALMANMSFVPPEQRVCPVCGKTFATRHLRPSFERYTVTDYDLCPEHAAMQQEFVALAGCDPTRSTFDGDRVKEFGDVHRTGRFAHVRRTEWASIFGETPCPAAMAFVEDALIDKLEAMRPAEDKPPTP